MGGGSVAAGGSVVAGGSVAGGWVGGGSAEGLSVGATSWVGVLSGGGGGGLFWLLFFELLQRFVTQVAVGSTEGSEPRENAASYCS